MKSTDSDEYRPFLLKLLYITKKTTGIFTYMEFDCLHQWNTEKDGCLHNYLHSFNQQYFLFDYKNIQTQ